MKDYLRRLKRDREGFRSGTEALRAEHGTVSIPILLDDYDAHFERRKVLVARVSELKSRYHSLMGMDHLSGSTSQFLNPGLSTLV